MWQVLKAEMAYARPWLVGALGIASAVAVLITFILAYGTDDSDAWVGSGIRGMFFLMAPLIVGFVMQGHRRQEHRARLLLAGPLTPRQVALLSVIQALGLLAVGVGFAGSLMLIEGFIRGTFDSQAVHLTAMVGGVMFATGQMVALAQESVAARQERRRAATWVGWGLFVAAVLAYIGCQVFSIVERTSLTWRILHVTNGVVAVVAMVVSVLLFERRTDFTH